MKGRVLGFSDADGTGAISADDGTRFRFVRDDWRGDRPPAAGMAVDFEAADGAAKDIYPVRGSAAASLPNVDLGALATSPGASRVGALFTESLATPLAVVVLLACFMAALTTPLISFSLFGLGSLPGVNGPGMAAEARASGFTTVQTLLVLRYAAPVAALWVIWAAWAGKDTRLPMLVTGGSAIFAAVLVFALKQAAVAAAGEFVGAAVGAMIGIGIGTWLLLLAGAGLVAAGLGIIRNPLAKR